MRCRSQRFDCILHTASLHHKAWSAVISCFSIALIGVFRSLLFHSVICSLGGPLSHGFPVVVFFDRGHPRFWNFYSTIPVDVVRVKSYMKCMLFTRKCHVVERSLKWQNGIWLVEYNSSTWKKLPYLHVVQWLGIFKLDFGRCFHSTWWNVSCLACVLWEKEREKHILN